VCLPRVDHPPVPARGFRRGRQEDGTLVETGRRLGRTSSQRVAGRGIERCGDVRVRTGGGEREMHYPLLDVVCNAREARVQRAALYG
jgi:hypothetical protein